MDQNFKSYRDGIVQKQRSHRQRLRLHQRRQEIIEKLNYEDLKLENYINDTDIENGTLEHKMVVERGRILRESIKSSSFKGIFDQIKFFKVWVSHENARESGRLDMISNAGLIGPIIDIYKEFLSSEMGVLIFSSKGLDTIKRDYLEKYNLMVALAWLIGNLTSGSKSVLTQVEHNGYIEIAMNLLSAECFDIFQSAIISLGNFLGCDSVYYGKIFQDLMFPQKIIHIINSKKELIFNDLRVMADTAWLLSSYCLTLQSVDEFVSYLG